MEEIQVRVLKPDSGPLCGYFFGDDLSPAHSKSSYSNKEDDLQTDPENCTTNIKILTDACVVQNINF
jgi:hypothetical protein